MNMNDKFLNMLFRILRKIYSGRKLDEAIAGLIRNTSDAEVFRFARHVAEIRGFNRYNAELYSPSGILLWKDVVYNLVVNQGLNDNLDKYFKGSAYTAAFFAGLINEVATSTITGITQANPGIVSTPSTAGLVNGDVVRINNVAGMTQVNGNEYTISSLVANTSFSIGIDTTGFGAYTSGGNWWKDPVVAADTIASHAGWTENVGYSEATRPAITLGTVASQSVDNSAAKAVFTANATGSITGVFVATDNTKGGTTGLLYGGGVFVQGTKGVTTSDTLNVTTTFTAASA